MPPQTKTPNLRAPAQEQELQHSPSSESELMLVHRNILGYKPAASGGPAELSPVMSEKPGPAWEQGALTAAISRHATLVPTNHSPPRHQGPGSPKAQPDNHQKWMLRLHQAYCNTPTQLPSPGATRRVADSCDFIASLAILAIFLKAW